jgi:hypothetical protein
MRLSSKSSVQVSFRFLDEEETPQERGSDWLILFTTHTCRVYAWQKQSL